MTRFSRTAFTALAFFALGTELGLSSFPEVTRTPGTETHFTRRTKGTLAQLMPGLINNVFVATGACPIGSATTFFASGTTDFTLPACFNTTNNKWETIAGGSGGGTGSGVSGSGGSGGGYSRSTNLAIAPGTTVRGVVGAQVAAATAGNDTWLCNATTNCATIGGTAVQVGGKAGTAGANNAAGGVGTTTGAVGVTKNAGGNGGSSVGFNSGGGGGGAAGPAGVGGNGVNGAGGFSTNGGAGGTNAAGLAGGAGGIGTGGTGGTGGNGTDIGNGTKGGGSGGGGGGIGATPGGIANGGPGGQCGGGGGGGTAATSGNGTGGTGTAGCAAITYTN